MNYQAYFKTLLLALKPDSNDGFTSPVCDVRYATITNIQDVVRLWNKKIQAEQSKAGYFGDHTGGVNDSMLPLEIIERFDSQNTLTELLEQPTKL